MTQIRNPAAYERGKRAAIAANARKTAQKEWEKIEDHQMIEDFLTQSGEFAPKSLTKDPADQAEYERLQAEAEAIKCNNSYWQELDRLAERFDARMVENPITRGMFAGDFGEFLLKLRDTLWEWGKLTEKQAAVVRKTIAKRKAWEAERVEKLEARLAEDREGSDWIGDVKERRDFTLNVEKVLEFDGYYGISYLHIAKDGDGNVVIYKGTKNLGEGEITLKATIKAHETRDGVKQTIITRPHVPAS